MVAADAVVLALVVVSDAVTHNVAVVVVAAASNDEWKLVKWTGFEP